MYRGQTTKSMKTLLDPSIIVFGNFRLRIFFRGGAIAPSAPGSATDSNSSKPYSCYFLLTFSIFFTLAFDCSVTPPGSGLVFNSTRCWKKYCFDILFDLFSKISPFREKFFPAYHFRSKEVVYYCCFDNSTGFILHAT